MINQEIVLSDAGNNRIVIMESDGIHIRYITTPSGNSNGDILDIPIALACRTMDEIYATQTNSSEEIYFMKYAGENIQRTRIHDNVKKSDVWHRTFGLTNNCCCMASSPNRSDAGVLLSSQLVNRRIIYLDSNAHLIHAFGNDQGFFETTYNFTGLTMNAHGEIYIATKDRVQCIRT